MTLTERFQLLATAPDAVARLRELILSLAVHGKLVPQDPSDEPAGALLKKIRIEKDRLIAQGKIRRDKPLPEIADEEKAFALPAGWEWARMQQIADARLGKMLDKAKNGGKPYPYLRNTNVQWHRFDLEDIKVINLEAHELDEYRLRSGDLLICEGGEPGRCAIWREQHREMYFQKALHRVRPLGGILPEYVSLCLEIDAKSRRLEQYFTGATIKHFAGQELSRYCVPLPPLAEQSRIVVKVDELMRLCDELETCGRLEAEHHTRLTTTLLEALAASESSHALAENWSRVAAHFDLLLDRPEAVDALEKTILELAVRGLLLPPDERNGKPALLHGTTTASPVEHADETTNDSPNIAPYEIPSSWSWIRFGEIVEELRYGTSTKCDYKIKGVPVLRIPNLRKGRISTDDLKFGPLTPEEAARLAVVPGDLLLVRSNGSATLVGSTALVGEESRDFAFAGYLMRVRLRENVALPTYVLLAMETAGVRAQIEGPIRTTSGVKNINSTEVSKLAFPLPPLKVQQRIVEQVDKLRRLCANLREQVLACQAAQAHFAEAQVEQAASAVPLVADKDELAAAA